MSEAAAPAPSPAVSKSALPPRPPRILVVDWLRGFGVVTMVLAHSFDAWMVPAERVGWRWGVIRHLSGIPSRLFLFLVGVSAAIVIESHLARGKGARDIRWRLFTRGLAVIGLAYLFRLQQHVLAGFWGGWTQLLRVDILNCIGLSLVMLSVVAVPSAREVGAPLFRRLTTWRCLGLAALFVGFGAIVGPAIFPDWLPRGLSSYIGGQRPMSWFPLFPWGAWSLVGVVIGHLWLQIGRDAEGQRRCFVVGGIIGAALSGSVLLVREVHPQIIRYPSELVQQMGPGSFFYRLGVLLLLSLLAWLVTSPPAWLAAAVRRPPGGRFSPMRQLGQTSLLIYWVHIEICYGYGARPIQKQLSMGQTLIGYLLLLAAMLALSLFRTRHGPALSDWWRRRRQAAVAGRSGAGAPGANL